MTDADLIARLTQICEAGFRQWRKQKRGGGLMPTPHRLIDEIVAGFAPVLRELVRETVAAHEEVDR